MYTGKIDVATFLFYIFIGIFSFACIKKAMGFRERRVCSDIEQTYEKKVSYDNLLFLLFIVVFTFIASFRTVGHNVGGADALNYIDCFLSAYKSNGFAVEHNIEPLFHLYCKVIRRFTDNYHVFFVISYGFISTVYVLFLKKYCPPDISYIPFLLIVFPYLKSFCTLRSSMAVAVVLLSLLCIDKHKFLSLALIISSFFVHRSSIIILPVYFVYVFLKGYFSRLQGKTLFFTVAICVVLAYALAGVLQSFVLQKGLLDGTDVYYLAKSTGVSIFSRWPMYFAHLCLFVALLVFSKKLPHTETIDMLKTVCIYDIIIMPASIVLGFWRTNEFLYLARLIMWGIMIGKGEKYIDKRSRFIYRGAIALVFLAWLIFRIFSEWDELKIMPYSLDLF